MPSSESVSFHFVQVFLGGLEVGVFQGDEIETFNDPVGRNFHHIDQDNFSDQTALCQVPDLG